MKKHITTVTLNPCIDRTIFVPSFKLNSTNHIDKIREEIAGKGINVAVALKHMDIPCYCLGFGFEEDYEKMTSFLLHKEIPYELVKTDGHLRVNLKIFDTVSKHMTECNEKGLVNKPEVMEHLYHSLNSTLENTEILVLDGSVPQGIDSDCYAKMLRMANQKEIRSILDATGELLLEGIKEKPYLIKPNIEEFITTFQCEEKDIIKKSEELVHCGIRYICISLGENGAMLISQRGVIKMPAVSVTVRSLQGAGDAMVAGICKAIWDKKENHMLDFALASAASSIQLDGTQMGTLECFNHLLLNDKIKI